MWTQCCKNKNKTIIMAICWKKKATIFPVIYRPRQPVENWCDLGCCLVMTWDGLVNHPSCPSGIGWTWNNVGHVWPLSQSQGSLEDEAHLVFLLCMFPLVSDPCTWKTNPDHISSPTPNKSSFVTWLFPIFYLTITFSCQM